MVTKIKEEVFHTLNIPELLGTIQERVQPCGTEERDTLQRQDGLEASTQGVNLSRHRQREGGFDHELHKLLNVVHSQISVAAVGLELKVGETRQGEIKVKLLNLQLGQFLLLLLFILEFKKKKKGET